MPSQGHPLNFLTGDSEKGLPKLGPTTTMTPVLTNQVQLIVKEDKKKEEKI